MPKLIRFDENDPKSRLMYDDQFIDDHKSNTALKLTSLPRSSAKKYMAMFINKSNAFDITMTSNRSNAFITMVAVSFCNVFYQHVLTLTTLIELLSASIE